jgi:serine phosphatase RsbU (regulator of sigma subunit)/CHASE2 domain-containing sensor protein
MTGWKSLSERKRISPRFGGIIAALIVAALLQWVGPETLQRPVFDLWQRVTPNDLSHSPVRIVWIDDLSLRKYGAWPWPRHVLGELTARIASGGAKVIGFDMLFPETDRLAPSEIVATYPRLGQAATQDIEAQVSTDQGFADVIGRAPVVLGRAGVDQPRSGPQPVLAVEAIFAHPLPLGVRHWQGVIANIPAIDDVGLGHGLLNGDRDADGIVRHVPLVGTVAGTHTPGFALEMARVASGGEGIKPEIVSGTLKAIRISNKSLPVSPDGRMALHFGAVPGRHIASAADILDGTINPGMFREKIVIIALKGAGTADLVTSPLKKDGYGAEVQANAIDAILTGHGLARPFWAWLAEGLLTVLIVAVALRLLPGMRPSHASLAAGVIVLAVLGASLAAFQWGALLLDPIGPLLTASATGATMLMMLFGETRRHRAQLSATLAEERVSAAKAAGELDAARAIQLGMLPDSRHLAKLDLAIRLEALIEPARSVGGDFYDAVRIDDNHLCVLVADVTGKGVPAALFMALSRALTKSVLLRDGTDLAAAVCRLNDEIARDNSEDMFVTMIIGVIDTKSGTMNFCNAGHENPWIVSADGVPRHLKPDGGPPLAVIAGFPYETESLKLAPGETLVLVSDGITEAQSPTGHFFGDGGVASVLAQVGASGPVCQALRDAVRAFENGLEATDDLTVMSLCYEAPRAI